jgi:hypothetical protein
MTSIAAVILSKGAYDGMLSKANGHALDAAAPVTPRRRAALKMMANGQAVDAAAPVTPRRRAALKIMASPVAVAAVPAAPNPPATPSSVAEARRLWEDKMSSADTVSVATDSSDSPAAQGPGFWGRLKNAATQNKYVSSAVSIAVNTLTEKERRRADAAEAERDAAHAECERARALAIALRRERDEARDVAGGALLAMLTTGPLDWGQWARWAGATCSVVVALRVARRLRQSRPAGVATPEQKAAETEAAGATEERECDSAALHSDSSNSRQKAPSIWSPVLRPLNVNAGASNAHHFLQSYLPTCIVAGAVIILAERYILPASNKLEGGACWTVDTLVSKPSAAAREILEVWADRLNRLITLGMRCAPAGGRIFFPLSWGKSGGGGEA